MALVGAQRGCRAAYRGFSRQLSLEFATRRRLRPRRTDLRAVLVCVSFIAVAHARKVVAEIAEVITDEIAVWSRIVWAESRLQRAPVHSPLGQQDRHPARMSKA